jgi:hypothetical protein
MTAAANPNPAVKTADNKKKSEARSSFGLKSQT